MTEEKTIEEIVQDKATIDELENKLSQMESDKLYKCEAARDQLVEMLDVTASKYRTVTGTAEALRIVRFITGDSASFPLSLELDLANLLAQDLANDTEKMRKLAEELPYEKMDSICEDFYDSEFIVKAVDPSDLAEAIQRMAHEMMRVDLCRNVGGAAEDMVSFINRVDEEIETTKAALEELRSEDN